MQLRKPNGDPADQPAEEFDLLAAGPPRGGSFVQIGAVARPLVQRLAEHLVDKGAIKDANDAVK